MNLPDTTVIVPARNEIPNVPAFLHSLPPEIYLVVVDASTDETPELIMRLRPQRTRVLRSEVNVTRARQLGAEAAHTPWQLYTDMDVAFAPDYFETLERCEPGDAVYGPKLSAGHDFAQFYSWFARGQQLADWLGVPAVSGSNLLVKREALKQIGGFDLELPCNEDSELGWRLKRSGFDIRFVPGLVVYARDHRRLNRPRGISLKLTHSLTRCALLYFGLLPARLRRHDWGYWGSLANQQES